MSAARAAAGLAVAAAAALLLPEAAAAADGSGGAEWADRLRKALVAGLLFAGLGAAGVLALRADGRRGGAWSQRLVGEASPTALGAIRAWCAAIALGIVAWEDLASLALMPSALAEPRGVMLFAWQLPGFVEALGSERFLRAFEGVTAALLLCAALGLGTRVTLPLAALAYLVFAGVLRAYTHFFHTGLLPLYLLAFLCLTPCGDGLSLDRWRRRRRGLVVPDAWRATARYGWARYGCWAIVGITYFAAGVAKLRNGDWIWWDAMNLRGHVLHGSLQQTRFFEARPGLWLAGAPDWMFEALGLGTLVLEIGMIAVLFSALARRLLPIGIAGVHVGILVLQKILFLDYLLLQLIFYDHSRWLGLRGAGAPGGEAAAQGAPAAPGRLPLATTLMTTLYLASVLSLVEFYPGTSWQMYSHRRKQPEITWYRAFAVGASGARAPFLLERCAPALFDARYVDVMRKPFRGEALEAVDLFVRRCAERGTVTLPGERAVAVEIEQRVWDFGAEPDDPHHGETAAVHRVALDGAAAP